MKIHKAAPKSPCLVIALALGAVPAGVVYGAVTAWRHWA